MADTPDHLPDDFLQRLRDLEYSYLSQDDPIMQSGYGGGPERWRNERILILDAVDRDGDFLDVGCANGYLLECLVKWAGEKGITLTPYGVDQGPRLIALARKRLPRWAANFWVANSWEWRPPRRFRYVYTHNECVPEALFRDYVCRLLTRYVEHDGVLIIGAYGSQYRNQPAWDVAANLGQHGFPVAGAAVCGEFPVTRIAWIAASPSAK